MTGLICSNQTGRFPITSNRGNKYLMIVLDYDSNAILSVPIPSHAQNHLLHAFSTIYDKLAAAGRTPTFVRLDNKVSHTTKAYMTNKQLKFQLVPPHNHRRNYAEKAIDTWKDHFIAGLSRQKFPTQTMVLTNRACRHITQSPPQL